MTKRILVSSIASLILTFQAIACDIHGKSGFAPENDLRISKYDKTTNGMTEEIFLDSINRVSSIYEPIVKSKGGNLKMNNKWDDATVNASAQRLGSSWVVNMYGGLARHPAVTVDGFMLVVCHELGHHIGGAPQKGGWGSAWASNEGQADYFGSMKCLRRVLQNEDNIAYVSNMVVDEEATAKCQAVYKSASEVALCQRISMAGKSLATLLGTLSGTPKVNFTTPDEKKVSKTNHNHPAAQCRLDTYFQGSLCDKSVEDDVDNKDVTKGVCIKKDGYEVGMRPLCWYKPTSAELLVADEE